MRVPSGVQESRGIRRAAPRFPRVTTYCGSPPEAGAHKRSSHSSSSMSRPRSVAPLSRKNASFFPSAENAGLAYCPGDDVTRCALPPPEFMTHTSPALASPQLTYAIWRPSAENVGEYVRGPWLANTTGEPLGRGCLYKRPKV